MNILIVDDEADIRETTAQLLELDGHQVDTTEDWAAVPEMVRNGAYDVLLQDLRMPGLDLVPHLEKVRASGELRIVLFTANRVLDSDAAGYDIDGLLTKPFDWQTLKDAVFGTG